MASQILAPLGCLGVLLCCALQASADLWTDNKPTEAWVNYDPTSPKPLFNASLTSWDGKDPCLGIVNEATKITENLCQTDIRNQLLAQNDGFFEKKDFLASCSTSGSLPEGIKTVCLLKRQRRSTRSLGSQHKTILEIQVYPGADKKLHVRFSEPYGHDEND
uniref:Uncharacterized protein n=1 Tax=Cacopsylla melanoneura TaxID=428564 RepID=A0A8D8Y2U9_9HEMI